MDDVMDMAAHYKLDKNGLPFEVRRASEPFSMGDLGNLVCVICRSSFRSISRYSRIMRRAMLDEATRKLVTWSRANYIALTDRLLTDQKKLEKAPATKTTLPVRPKGIRTRRGGQIYQLENLQKIAGKSRYGSLIQTWHTINSYVNKVRKVEQPLQQVSDLVKYSNLQHSTEETFPHNEAVIQYKERILAVKLRLQCNILILSDFIELGNGAARNQTKFEIDLSAHLLDSEYLIELAHKYMHPKEVVQGHIFAAQLYGFSRLFASCAPLHTSYKERATTNSAVLKKTGLFRLAQAREILEKYPFTSFLEAEIDAVENMLNGSVYRRVTTKELKAANNAMAGEFSKTGHWHICQNGHIFTISDCEIPTEQAICPECTAPIRGQNQQAEEGMKHTVDKEIAGEIDRLVI